jgi:uroporphyrinogen decarboxylase
MTMTKIERVRAALAGTEVDRPPFSVWYHFGLQHAPAERTAQIHVEFFEAYNLDWLKVMNDYSYPMPRGIETLSDARDLKRIIAFDVRQGSLGEQLETIRLIGQSLRGKALVVDTIFNAWNTLKRNVLKEAMGPLMEEHPAELEAALAVVNDNLIRYAIASLHGGASGIFFSVPATPESLTAEQYERFMRPFDLAFLEAIRPFGEFHVLHAHGKELYLDRLQEYPVHAISWADREAGPPLALMRRTTPRALMGGIDHGSFPYTSAAKIREQIRTAIAEAGSRKLFIAPGCAIPSYSFPELIRAARAEVGKD